MSFSTVEREARLKALQKMIAMNHLEALLLIGDTNVGPDFYGDLRYYADNRIIFHRQVALLFSQHEPVLFTVSEIQKHGALQRSSVKDCRSSDNLIEDTAKFLKARGISGGRIGVNLEMLPASWYLYLKRELPQIEWVEIHDQIMRIRLHRSEEEMEIYRKGGELGDGSFEAVLKMIRPGVDEYEIAASIEQYALARGAEEHFTLISSGKFSLGDDNALPLPFSPSPRKMEPGDSILMEITPRYRGYWTQLVRTVNVGIPNRDLKKIHQICCDAIQKGLEILRPGITVRNLVLAMEDYVAGCGFLLKPPLGHICGVDLVEARVTRQNEMVLEPGTAIIIHPTVFTPDGKKSFFWGETYLVKEHGYERLNRSSDELSTL